jgi:hypothetical protein
MGRSQVAYNRTKLRIRGGRGGSSVSGRDETGDRSVSSNQSHRNRHESNTSSNSNTTNDNDKDTAAPSVSTSWRKPKRYPRDQDSVNSYSHDEDKTSRQSDNCYNEADAAANFKNFEADLLLDMQSAQAYAYATPSSAEVGTFSHNSGIKERGGSGGLNLLSSTSGDGDTHSAILNVSVMAAALNQLPLSQRFMIPQHLAATLVINGEEDDDGDDEAHEEEKVEDEVFHAYEDESVPTSGAAARDTVVPVPPVDSAAPVRIVAATPSVLKIPIPVSSTSESVYMQAGVPKPSEQRKNHRREAAHQDDVSLYPPKVVDVAVDVSAADPQRRRNLIQRASVTSPIDLMNENDDDDQADDNPGEFDDDDMITRLRRLDMECSTSREGDLRASVSSTANATAPTLAANTNITSSSTAVIIDCTSGGGEEDADMWLDTALAGSEIFETKHAEEGEGQLDDWLDGAIE